MVSVSDTDVGPLLFVRNSKVLGDWIDATYSRLPSGSIIRGLEVGADFLYTIIHQVFISPVAIAPVPEKRVRPLGAVHEEEQLCIFHAI